MARAHHQSDLPRSRTFLHRAALVVGGGIAGLSAAEELADAGIEVHLVERQQSIGGYMARLSKTFPTEDCAMCSLAPRLTNAATDARIHIHALSDVTKIVGPPGEFRVTIRHKPRYVTEKCVGCGECVPACPVKLKSEFDFGVTERTAISRPFANAVPATFAIERKGWSPCKTACPVHTSAHGYVALVAAGRFDDAYRVASDPNPFPSVCGRICTHVCETECTRGQVEEPIAIAGLKRFVADTAMPTEPPAPIPPVFDERVAVVGGGPAGLTAARELARLGYAATVFEALPRPAACCASASPSTACQRPCSTARSSASWHWASSCARISAGREFTVDSLFADGYKAIFLATGLQASKDLPLPGLEQRGVVRAVEFLRDQALGVDRRRASAWSSSAAATWPSTPGARRYAVAPSRSTSPASKTSARCPLRTRSSKRGARSRSRSSTRSCRSRSSAATARRLACASSAARWVTPTSAAGVHRYPSRASSSRSRPTR